MPFNKELPNVQINELEINEETIEIYAATYGRGLWFTPICDLSVPISYSPQPSITLELYPNPINLAVTIRLNTGARLTCDIRMYGQDGKLLCKDEDVDV